MNGLNGKNNSLPGCWQLGLIGKSSRAYENQINKRMTSENQPDQGTKCATKPSGVTDRAVILASAILAAAFVLAAYTSRQDSYQRYHNIGIVMVLDAKKGMIYKWDKPTGWVSWDLPKIASPLAR